MSKLSERRREQIEAGLTNAEDALNYARGHIVLGDSEGAALSMENAYLELGKVLDVILCGNCGKRHYRADEELHGIDKCYYQRSAPPAPEPEKTK